MGKNSLILNRIEVKKLDFSKNLINLSLVYSINGAFSSIEKTIQLNDSVMSWSVEAIKIIKDKVNKSTGINPALGENQTKFIEQEKLIKGINKLMGSIAKLKEISEAQKYMNAFHSINNQKIIL